MNANSLCVLVPQPGIARVIGKQGAGLKRIRETMGSKIKVIGDAPEGVTTRRVEMSGSAEQLSLGFLQVLAAAYDKEQTADVQVLVPAESAGAMVGKGAANLKLARETTGVRVQIERDVVQEQTTGAQERMVTFSGEIANMGMALSCILRAVGGSIPKRNAGGGGGKGKHHSQDSHAPAIGAYGGGYQLAHAAPEPQGQADYGPVGLDTLQVQFVIPQFAMGYVVGDHEYNLQRIRTAAECEVIISGSNDGNAQVCITGNITQCYVAQSMVYDKLTHAAWDHGRQVAQVSVILYVPKVASGGVIGKGGEVLKDIRQITGTKIDFSRDDIRGHRPCTITGSFLNVLMALEQISQIITQAAVERPKGKGGGKGMKRSAPPPEHFAPLQDAYAGELNAQDTHGQPPAAKRQRLNADARHDEPLTKVLLPAQTAGAVIGKGGANLTQLRERCEVKVELMKKDEAPQWPSDRLAIIRGPDGNRRQAMESLLRAAYQEVPADVADCHLKLLVPSNQAGGIIGKQGKNLNRFRDECGISVKVEREEIFGDRLVHGQGTLAQILLAVGMIMDMASSPPPANRLMDGPRSELE